jgi:hypothetical protein
MCSMHPFIMKEINDVLLMNIYQIIVKKDNNCFSYNLSETKRIVLYLSELYVLLTHFKRTIYRNINIVTQTLFHIILPFYISYFICLFFF